MRTYDVEMEITFKKALRVRAQSAEDAFVLAEDIFLESDAVELTEDDLCRIDADVSTASGEKKSFCADYEDDELMCERCMSCHEPSCLGCCMADDDDEEGDDSDACADDADDYEDRVDDLIHRLMEALEDSTAAKASVMNVASELKALTGEDIFSQLLH